jgi:hypothetical protein
MPADSEISRRRKEVKIKKIPDAVKQKTVMSLKIESERIFRSNNFNNVGFVWSIITFISFICLDKGIINLAEKMDFTVRYQNTLQGDPGKKSFRAVINNESFCQRWQVILYSNPEQSNLGVVVGSKAISIN